MPVDNVATMNDIAIAVNAIPVAVGGGAFIPPPALVNLQNQVAGLTAALAGVPAALAALLISVNANTASINANTASINANTASINALKDDVALANNRGCFGAAHVIMPRTGVVGLPPPYFPRTLNDLMACRTAQSQPILIYYGLAVHGNAKAKCTRIALYLGIPAHIIS